MCKEYGEEKSEAKKNRNYKIEERRKRKLF